MSGIIIVAEVRDGEVQNTSLELITAAVPLARETGEEVTAIALAEPPIASALDIAGVNRVIAVRSGGEFNPQVVERALSDLIAQRSPRLVLFSHAPDGMSVAPALAAQHRAGFASDVIELDQQGETITATREFYGGKLKAEIELTKSLTVVTVRSGAFAAAEGNGSAELVEVEVTVDQPRIRHVDFVQPPRSDIDLAGADFVLSLGRGIGDRENLHELQALADRIGATLAASRPLVDAGWIESGRQIGQSGQRVAPRVYLALGISGAVQHLTGMRDAEVIIAVNTDPTAPIFGVAHYGVVGDLFEIARELGGTA